MGILFYRVMEKQKEVLEITANLWNKYLEIPKNEVHPDDNNDIRFHIHAIQNIMFTQLYKAKKMNTDKEVSIIIDNYESGRFLL